MCPLIYLFVIVQFYRSFALNSRDFDVLTENLMKNLEGDPHLLVDGNLSEYSRGFIEKQFGNCLRLVLKQDGSKKKRSLDDDLLIDPGSEYLDFVLAKNRIPVRFTQDLILFKQNNRWYSAALESNGGKKEEDSFLVLFQYQNNSVEEITRMSLKNGIKIATFELNQSTLIAVAQNSSLESNMGIYEFSAGVLRKIQQIDMEFASDLELWRVDDQVFLTVAQFMHFDAGKAVTYEVETPIYRWKQTYFDLVQTIPTKGVRKITAFTMDGAHLLAVANFRNTQGETKIYSDIYKYDYETEKYEIFHRILTKACTDIRYFALVENNRYVDHFLIVANSYEEDSKGNRNYEVDSLIYKYVDDYFIPFQSLRVDGLEKWLPVNTLNNGLVLFAVSRFSGIRTFQYDGWEFGENLGKLPESLQQQPHIKSISFYYFNGNYVLVVADKTNDGRFPNMFELVFKREKRLQNIHDEMYAWCATSLNRIDSMDSTLGVVNRADIEITTAESEKNLDEIGWRLDALNSMVDGLESEAAKSLKTPDVQELSTPINAQEAVFNQKLIIHHINHTKINGVVFNNTFIENLHVTGSINVREINGKSYKNLAHRNDNMFFEKITVNGEMIADRMEIIGALNGVEIDARNVLMRDGNQNIPKYVQFNDIHVENFEALSLNGRGIDSDLQQTRVDHVKNLTVQRLTIGGYLNDIDIATLNKYTLRKTGDQIVTAEYTFKNLQGGNLAASLAMIDIDAGAFALNQDLIFNQGIQVKHLKVTESLCGLPIDDLGHIDVLLANKTEAQRVTGRKLFENVTVTQPILLQGKIRSKELDKMNPVVSINEPFILSGDVRITGDVTVEDSLNTFDVGTPSLHYSLHKVLKSGLKLSDGVIKPKLWFVQQINVEELFTDRINDLAVENVMMEDSKDMQIVQGVKHFEGNVSVKGPVSLVLVNGVNVEDLEQSAMSIRGEQHIDAEHFIKEVITERVNCTKTTFSNNPNDASTKIINGDLNIDSIKTRKITVKGLIAGKNFTDIVNDTVVKNSTRPIFGTKHFENLTVDNLITDSGLQSGNFMKIFNPINGELSLDKNITINGPLKTVNVFYEEKCNGLEKNDFGKGNVNKTGDHKFNQLIIYGNVTISQTLNAMNLSEIFEDTVKIDEDYNFTNLVFGSNVVAKQIALGGFIENIDLENIITSRSEHEQTISHEITLKNVSVNGTITFKSYVNNLKLDDFVKYATDSTQKYRNLTIEGNAYFAKGPNVAYVNGKSVDFIKDNAWFNDLNTTFEHAVQFQSAVFEDHLVVEKLMDNVNLTWIAENYMSKTKDQQISAAFTCEKVVFQENITVLDVDLSREVNRINLGKFLSIVLLDSYDQIFETTPFFDNCTIKEIGGDFTVTGLHLDTDVMRYDKINIVTGRKRFENLDIDSFKSDNNITIQDVDLVDWFKNAVMTTGSYNLTGKKIFQNVDFAKGVRVDGLLNGLKFDEKHVMLKNMAQNVTGFKHFNVHPFDPVHFKSVKLKGRLNGIDVTNLINNQAYKHRNNTFKSSLIFSKDLNTSNVVFRKNFRGINMSGLMENVTNLGVLNNLLDSYTGMDVMAYKIEESFKNQAFYLSYYKSIQEVPSVSDSKIIVTIDGTPKISTTSNASLFLFDFEQNTETLLSTLPYRLAYYEQVFSNRYLYTEDLDKNGHFYEFFEGLQEVFIVPCNATLSTASYTNPTTKESCTVFMSNREESRIFCENSRRIRLVQVLHTPAAFKVTAMTLSESQVYLVTLHKQTDGYEAHLNVWRLNEDSFSHVQTVFTTEPKSIAWVSHRNKHFLAMALGHVPEAMLSGSVEIYKIDASNKLIPWQNVDVSAPIQVEFAILPTKELVLYVVSENPTEPFLMYQYEGVAGFREKVVGSTLPKIRYIHSIVKSADHYVLAQGHGKITVIKAVFKGEILSEPENNDEIRKAIL